MTREEARQIIATWLVSSKGTEEQRGYIEGWFDKEDEKAFALAIEALSDTPTNTPTNTPTCNKKQVTGKLKNADDSLLTAGLHVCNEQKSKLDFISRQQAVEAMEKEIERIHGNPCAFTEGDYHYQNALKLAQKIIEMQPSVTPTVSVVPIRAEGKWEIDESRTEEWYRNPAICSCCGHETLDDNNFCPSCGAKMKG